MSAASRVMDTPGQNLVMLLTPPGIGAIATIRLRGPVVDEFVRRHLTRTLATGRCVHVELREGDSVIDDPVAVRVDPDTVDLSLHGGTWVVERALALARGAGFAVVESGSHAFESNDPVEREMLEALPRALSTEAIAILLAQPGVWRSMLESRDPDAIRKAMDDRSLHHLLNPPEVAIVGAPNVGKSTIANQLFARDHSITADLPGTTRDWVGEHANIDGLVVKLIDTPGVRVTDDPIERAAIARARHVVTAASLVVHVLDVTQPLDAQLAVAERRVSEIVVLNKTDRESLFALDEPAIYVCGLTGSGIDELRRRIRSAFGCENLQSHQARCWTDRQSAHLDQVLAS